MAQESIREGGGPSCWWCAARGCARKRDSWCNNECARASERASRGELCGVGSEQVEGVTRRRTRAGGSGSEEEDQKREGAGNIFILQTPGVGRRWQPRRDSVRAVSSLLAARARESSRAAIRSGFEKKKKPPESSVLSLRGRSPRRRSTVHENPEGSRREMI